SFATIGGAHVIADPVVGGSVTAHFDDVPWSNALDSICRDHDLACYWQPGAPPTLRVGPSDVGFSGLAESISLELKGAQLSHVLEAFQVIGDEALALAPDLAGTVDIKLNAVPWPVALDHICSVAACAVDWTASPPAVTAAPHRLVEEPSFEAFSTTEAALERIAASPALGPMAPRELVVDDGLPQVIKSHIVGGTWSSTLDRLCDELDCTWRLVYGEPSQLRLRPRDARVERKMPFEKGDVDAAELARSLAEAAGVELQIGDDFEAKGTVTVRRNQPTWQGLADRLCGDIGCTWRLSQKTLHLEADRRPMASLPIRRSEPVAIDLRIHSRQETAERTSDTRIETRASFTWARPVARLAAGDDRWLHLAWIPFEEPVILPLVADCGDGSVEWLKPVGLPLDDTFYRRTGDLRVELAPAPPAPPRPPRPTEASEAPDAPRPEAPPTPPAPPEGEGEVRP
ncbi:MAG: hypothetical protein AAFY88_25215, partial [Acidobacteriota bacterium]